MFAVEPETICSRLDVSLIDKENWKIVVLAVATRSQKFNSREPDSEKTRYDR